MPTLIPEKRDAVIRDLVQWFVEHRREMRPGEMQPILREHLSEADMREFTDFLSTPEGKDEFKKRLKLEAWKVGDNPQYGFKEKQPFIRVGERVRYIGSLRGRYETWPEGAWLEYGVTGTVKEYHPEQPAVRVGREYFEAIPPYAVVRWDFGGETAIDPDDEGKRWSREGHSL